MIKSRFVRSVLSLSVLAVAFQAQAGTTSYLFNGNLNAEELGMPSLTAVDPSAANSYGTAFLYGGNRTTYHTAGAAGIGNNAGVDLDASTFLPTGLDYTLEMVVSIDTVAGGWRKLADMSGLSSDAGLYASNQSFLQLYPSGTGTTTMNAGETYYIALTVNSNGEAKGYLNGNLEFTGNSANATGNMFSFFQDEAGTGSNEYSNVTVGLLRLNDRVLSASEIGGLAVNPYAQPVPEPASMAALGLGAAALLRRRSKR